jgi:hypothetical protein
MHLSEDDHAPVTPIDMLTGKASCGGVAGFTRSSGRGGGGFAWMAREWRSGGFGDLGRCRRAGWCRKKRKGQMFGVFPRRHGLPLAWGGWLEVGFDCSDSG